MEEIEDISVYIVKLEEMVFVYGARLVLAIVVLVVGLWLIRRFIVLMEKVMIKREVDESLLPFLKSIMSITLKVVLILSMISTLGVPTALWLFLPEQIFQQAFALIAEPLPEALQFQCL